MLSGMLAPGGIFLGNQFFAHISKTKKMNGARRFG
jgi:hypothetical protein